MVKTQNWTKPVKTALSASLYLFYALTCVQLVSAQTATNQTSPANGQSLIESALEGKYQAPTDTTSNTSNSDGSVKSGQPSTSKSSSSKSAVAKSSSKNSHHKSALETAASPAALPSAPLLPASGDNIPLRGEIKPSTSSNPSAAKSNSASATKSPNSSNSDPTHKPVVRLVKPVKPGKPVIDHNEVKPIVKLVKPAPAPAAAVKPDPEPADDAPEHKVLLTPVKVTDEQERIPEPTAQTVSPIHSGLPYHQPRLPLFDTKLGEEKVDKGYSIDTTYRGKATLPSVQTVSFGSTPSWAVPARRQLASALPGTSPATPANAVTVPATSAPVAPATTNTANAAGQANSAAASLSKTSRPQQLYEVNVRILTRYQFKQTDTLWVYPYPPKPPKQIIPNPLPDDDGRLRGMLLSTGYTARPDETRSYPSNGWRWIKAMDNAMEKAHLGVPHTMFTMYPWVNKMCPYVRAECTELNQVEEKRSERYDFALGDYQVHHADLEAQATARGYIPVEFKFTAQGVAQATLPKGNWWIAVSRAYPGLKFYWLVPISCSDEKIINVQLNEANALVIGGAW